MISCIVAAGGKSERMGRDKKFIKIEGKYFIQHVVERAKEFSDEVIVVVGSEKQVERTSEVIDVKILKDEEESRGPLMGILTGLKRCNSDYSIVVPCDNPFIEAKVFKHMIREAKGHDAVIPRWNNKIEPLRAIYKVQAMITAIERAIRKGKMGVTEAIDELNNVNYINIDSFRKYDRELLTFFNVNTEKDLDELLKKLDKSMQLDGDKWV